MELHKWIMELYKWIMELHNYGFLSPLALHTISKFKLELETLKSGLNQHFFCPFYLEISHLMDDLEKY